MHKLRGIFGNRSAASSKSDGKSDSKRPRRKRRRWSILRAAVRSGQYREWRKGGDKNSKNKSVFNGGRSCRQWWRKRGKPTRKTLNGSRERSRRRRFQTRRSVYLSTHKDHGSATKKEYKGESDELAAVSATLSASAKPEINRTFTPMPTGINRPLSPVHRGTKVLRPPSPQRPGSSIMVLRRPRSANWRRNSCVQMKLPVPAPDLVPNVARLHRLARRTGVMLIWLCVWGGEKKSQSSGAHAIVASYQLNLLELRSFFFGYVVIQRITFQAYV